MADVFGGVCTLIMTKVIVVMNSVNYLLEQIMEDVVEEYEMQNMSYQNKTQEEDADLEFIHIV